MAIVDLFSKRQKQLRGEVLDVYKYDTIPTQLRVQIVHIWHDCLGNESEYDDRHIRVKSAYEAVATILHREYGVFNLTNNAHDNYMEEVIGFFLKEKDAEKVLDVIDLSFRIADRFARSFNYKHSRDAHAGVDNAIEELNCRFKEHGVGFEYSHGEIIRIDSQLIHSEVVKPALNLLNVEEYAGAQQEFLKAYEHYRQGDSKTALNEALKAFESIMKAICDKRKWPYDSNDTSKRLIDICYKQGLVPAFWQHHMGALRSLLEGGVPTGRNKLSGHGQGTTPITVPEHIVAYVLHMTASAIVFLVRSEQNIA